MLKWWDLSSGEPLVLLDRIILVSLHCWAAVCSKRSLGLSQALCLSLSQAGKPASQQGLLTSAFEPRNFFLAVGDAEPELILAAPGLPQAQVPSASSHQTGKATELN